MTEGAYKKTHCDADNGDCADHQPGAAAILWEPSRERVEASALYRFLADKGFAGDGRLDYAAAHAWSLAEPGAFWSAVWEACGVIGDAGDVAYEPGVALRTARFFPGAWLNFAENLLRCADDTPALIAHAEGCAPRRLTRAELDAQAAAFAGWLVERGVAPGDRVAALMPNVPETMIAMLGTARIGAVFSSASPDFGVAGVLDRFGQIAPKILIACDGYRYGGKLLDIRDKLEQVRAALPSLVSTVMVPHLDLGPAAGTTPWTETVSGTGPAPPYARLAFDHPLYILFSSGTTGKPKCMVHGAGGTLLQHLKEHRLHCDIRPGDRVFYFTTCGWMMWNWLASALASRATLVLYDGAPLHPEGTMLFDLAAREEITFFGLSAKLIDALKTAGVKPRESYDLPHLRGIASTGSPLAPEGFDYVYGEIKSDVHLASISGGTDIVSCFVLGNPCAPVRRGEIQCAGLGMAVEVWDETGHRRKNRPGELVCTAAFPARPVGFWDDPDGSRYGAAYYNRFPGVWCHGDFAIETETGGFVILGRSDATLNPGGVRIGTAEIYRQVEAFEEVREAIAVGQQWQGDERIVLFVTLQPGAVLTDDLRDSIRRRIRNGASPRHVPAKVVAVPDIPRTRSGKISELAVKQVIHGRPVQNTEALANPESLGHFRDLSDLAS